MKKYTGPCLVLPRIMRVIAVALIPVLLLTSMPVEALAATSAAVAKTATHARPFPGAVLGRPSPPRVQVNHTRPSATPPSTGLVFSAQPTETEIGRARVFDEPLLPIGGHASAKENKALAEALLAYVRRADNEDVSAITAFLRRYPKSAWRAALLTNLGLAYRRMAYFSKALSAWEEAWRLAKKESDMEARALIDRVAGELADLYARLGHERPLERLLAELAGRDLQGPATERLTAAREGLWWMRNKPEEFSRCGTYALSRVQVALQQAAVDTQILDARASRQGMSLAQLRALADQAGLPYRMARRHPGASIPLPAVVHWKLGHYGTLIKEENGRYLLQDPALDATAGNQTWVSSALLDAESSGYFLVPEGPWPDGWRAVSQAEGETVWGKGGTNDFCNDCHKPCDKKVGGGGGGCPTCVRGMAQYSIHALLVSLNIVDTPVGYIPPRGPDMFFTVTYNQREANQPAIFRYANLGPKWTFDWLSYITDNPSNPAANVSLYVSGGGAEPYIGFNPGTQSYAPQIQSQAVLVRTSPTSYERRLPNGGKEIFSQPDGATAFPRKIFMTQSVDPAGNTMTFTYDDRLRLVAAMDALGQVTTLSYDLLADPLKITQVTDPFGRSATFEYDGAGQLIRITDVIGLTSEFSYGAGNFINAMTTPYGTTTFAKGEQGTTRFLEATDPLGDKERAEFRHEAPGIAFSEPVAPAGASNDYLNFRNSFYWDKKAWAEFPGDYTKAHVFHWLHDIVVNKAAGVLESEKRPLESRIYYLYPGQVGPTRLSSVTFALPSKTARVLDDGTTQLYQYEYNSLGKTIKSTDPSGRVVSYVYHPNQIDLLEVRQTRGANNELLAKYTYNAQHRVLTETDAAGQTTTHTYNAFGQRRTRTNPKNETTTWAYDDNGYLLSITGPLAGATTTFAYDEYGRVQTLTDSEGYAVQHDYDALDRRVKKTFPDGTFKQWVYNRLDLEQWIDRLGRVSRASYNARRQPTAIQDPQGRTTQFDWCKCGSLQKITDARGQQTTLEYDVQGRITARVFPDGRRIQYRYENRTSRMKEIVDANGQTAKIQYYVDNNWKQIRYVGARAPSPPVAFTYDDNYNRVLTMRDGAGLTTYTYHPITTTPALGAGQIASISGPLPNSTITYSYDELSRVLVRAINGVPSRTSYDALGRVSQATNPLGTFNYSYVGATTRLSSIGYPNRQVTTNSYYDNVGDHRLQQIKHQGPAGSIISQFNYTYDAEGRITAWSKQADDQPPTTYAFDYDDADQLIGATLQNVGTGSAPSQFVYEYDLAGNRTKEQIDDRVTLTSYNNLNQLANQQSSILPDPDPVFHSSEIVYDGLGRRVRITEKEGGVVTSDKRFLWCGSELCEERDGTGATVTKRFYAQGAQINGSNYFYTRDHLGSLREMTDGAGAVRARYDYDPYGRRTKISGDLDADFSFTGLFSHDPSGLDLAVFRAYDANLGRWLSRDPIAEAGGLNLYGYVLNMPLNRIDSLGLSSSNCLEICADVKWNCLSQCNVLGFICAFGAAAAAYFAPGSPLEKAFAAAALGALCAFLVASCRDGCDHEADRCKSGCTPQCPGR